MGRDRHGTSFEGGFLENRPNLPLSKRKRKKSPPINIAKDYDNWKESLSKKCDWIIWLLQNLKIEGFIPDSKFPELMEETKKHDILHHCNNVELKKFRERCIRLQLIKNTISVEVDKSNTPGLQELKECKIDSQDTAIKNQEIKTNKQNINFEEEENTTLKFCPKCEKFLQVIHSPLLKKEAKRETLLVICTKCGWRKKYFRKITDKPITGSKSNGIGNGGKMPKDQLIPDRY